MHEIMSESAYRNETMSLPDFLKARNQKLWRDVFCSREEYRKPILSWILTGPRSALAQYTYWEYGLKFAARFMRDAAPLNPARALHKSESGSRIISFMLATASAGPRFFVDLANHACIRGISDYLFPLTWRTKAEAEQALRHITAVVAHSEGRRGAYLSDAGRRLRVLRAADVRVRVGA